MKRPFLLSYVAGFRAFALVAAGSGLIAATYGLVRLAYGLFLPDIQADLGFDAAVAGFISSGASVGYCVGAVAGMFVAARHPRLLVVTAGIAGTVGPAGMAASTNVGLFAVFAIVGAVAAGVASPGLIQLVTRAVRRESRDSSQAIVNAGTGPGLVAAGVLALVLLPDWRLAWALAAVFSLAVAAAVLLLDRRHGSGDDGVEDDDGSGDDGDVNRDDGAQDDDSRMPQPAVTTTWFAAHASIIVAALLMGAGSAAAWNYGRTLMVDAGAGDSMSAVAWIALGFGGVAVIATARVMAARTPRAAWTITTLTITAATAALALFPGSTAVALVAFALFGWGYIAGSGALIAWTSRIDETRAAAGTSLMFVVLVLGQAVGASALGLVITAAGFTVAFLVAAALALAAAILPGRRRTRGMPDTPEAQKRTARNVERRRATASPTPAVAPTASRARG
ncbi:MFS transporter [Marisediminicola senii]|uniref:MFS transporter n=1 Tax=Marisediminicola senii TaxID=2711233 RepID=UPI0013EE352C|nr:MFS transporter [Marisediminicola senii]